MQCDGPLYGIGAACPTVTCASPLPSHGTGSLVALSTHRASNVQHAHISPLTVAHGALTRAERYSAYVRLPPRPSGQSASHRIPPPRRAVEAFGAHGRAARAASAAATSVSRSCSFSNEP